jgi:hypothetical protein
MLIYPSNIVWLIEPGRPGQIQYNQIPGYINQTMVGSEIK